MILDNFPLFLQVCARPIYSRLKYNHVFNKQLNFLMESQWWTKEQIEEYQTTQLQKLINHAYKNVPYYTKVFDEREIRPTDIKSISDLKKIPFLTKKDVQNNFADLRSNNFPRWKFNITSTSGSTGLPTAIVHERGLSFQKEMAFQWRFRKWLGINFKDREAVLRGNVIRQKGGNKTTTYYQRLGYNNSLILSSYHMQDDILHNYVEKIREYGISVIRGYPSSLDILATYMKNRSIKLSGIKAVITSSETLHPFQRERICECFNAPVLDHYGNTELCAFISQCEESDLYHIAPEYGIIEILNEKNDRVTSESGRGEIIATGFINNIFPLIRYKTNDIGIWTNKKCKCEREHKFLKKIEGRTQDFVITKNNTKISLTSLIFAQHYKAFSMIKNMQIVQKNKGEIIIKIIIAEGYSKKNENEIRNIIVKCSNNGLSVMFDYVNEIPRTKAGKYRWFIQKLDTKFGDR